MSGDEERTVCVWERGGVHDPEDHQKLASDIAQALGAAPECVRVDESEPAVDGVWLTVLVFAPYVPKDWDEASPPAPP